MRHLGNAASAPHVDQLTTARPARGDGRARHPRGWYTRRALAAADLAGLFVRSSSRRRPSRIVARSETMSASAIEVCLFLLTLPLWLVFARALGLYDRDDARADHSTADETLGVINLVTLGTWTVLVVGWATRACPARARSIDQFLAAGGRVRVGRSRRCSDDRAPAAGLRPERRRDRRRACRAARRAQDPAASGVRDQGRRLRRRQPSRPAARDRRRCLCSAGSKISPGSSRAGRSTA